MRVPKMALVVAFACLAAGAAACGKESNDSAPVPQGGDLAVLTEETEGRLRHYELESPALAGDTGVDVLLPRGYEGSGRRFPVIYLFHGADADETFWTEVGLDSLLRGIPAIFVMPEADAGFYSNPFNDGAGGPPEWETYHLDELIPWVDAEFRTVAERSGRAAAGISMGGLGALLYTARRPGTFAAAASYSGLVQVEPTPMAGVLVATGRDPGILGPIWGAYPEERKNWEQHNPIALAPALDGVELVIATGDGTAPSGGGATDPVETQIHSMNVALHERLDALGVEHVWDEGPGVHDVPDWREAMRRTLPLIAEAVGAAAEPAKAPAAAGAG